MAKENLIQRLRAARAARHGTGELKLPAIPCLYEEAADRIEELQRCLIACGCNGSDPGHKSGAAGTPEEKERTRE